MLPVFPIGWTAAPLPQVLLELGVRYSWPLEGSGGGGGSRPGSALPPLEPRGSGGGGGGPSQEVVSHTALERSGASASELRRGGAGLGQAPGAALGAAGFRRAVLAQASGAAARNGSSFSALGLLDTQTP